MKLVTMLIMVALLGAAMRYARPYLMKSAGLPANMPTGTGTEGVHFSSEESDLMGTVFKSAIRLLTGSASRKELAGELSSKLYAGRGDAKTMSELGIEMEQPGGSSAPSIPGAPPKPGMNPVASPGAAGVRGAVDAANLTSRAPVAGLPSRVAASPAKPVATPGQRAADSRRDALLDRLRSKAVANPELALAPVVLAGMLLVHGIRRKRRRSPLDDMILPDMAALMPSDSDPYEMTHAVHALKAEDFELLVALIYQRQGYRVSMPAGLGGGRGGDFVLQRKSEKLLVQCKNMRQDHRIPIERVRELQEAAADAGVTRGLFVTSCGFSWDARNFAKAKGLTVINARTLDALLTEAREGEDEDLLAVARWGPKFMAKVKLTPPMCPTCEAEMDQINANGGPVWLCGQRPDCRGRRNARKYQDAPPARAAAPAKAAVVQAKPAVFAKLTKSVTFTKLTRSVGFTKPAKPAAPTRADAAPKPAKPAAAPAAPTKPASPTNSVVTAVPVKPTAPTPEEEVVRRAHLLAAFPHAKEASA